MCSLSYSNGFCQDTLCRFARQRLTANRNCVTLCPPPAAGESRLQYQSRRQRRRGGGAETGRRARPPFLAEIYGYLTSQQRSPFTSRPDAGTVEGRNRRVARLAF